MIYIIVLLFLYSFYFIFQLKIKQSFVDQLHHHTQIGAQKIVYQ